MLECGRYVELNPVRAGMVDNPAEYPWSSYRAYVNGERNDLVNLDPEYLGLDEKERERKNLYKTYVEDGKVEKRNEERFFKAGVYGSKEFGEEMKKRGLEKYL